MTNKVFLCGRLTRDVELRYTEKGLAVGKTCLALNRGKDRNGNDKGCDFVNVIVYGKQAETFSNFKHKGDLVLIEGRIQTGSYEKDNKKVYTTEVAADRVDFLSRDTNASENEAETVGVTKVPEGFTALEDEIPF